METLAKPTLSIITPTIGRPSLGATLDSAVLGKNDEWLVVGDGPQLYAEGQVKKRPKNVKYSYTVKTGNYGNFQRDVAMQLSFKDWFVFIDDDDVFAPNALNVIKRTLADSEPCPWIFRMITPLGRLLWDRPIVSRGVIGGSMLVLPNIPEKIAQWSDHSGYDSDFLFIQETLRLWEPIKPKWAADVIIVCKPMTMPIKMELTGVN